MSKRTLQLDWKGYYEYTSDNVKKYAPTGAGVYKISVKQKDDTLKVRYVGQANDLDRRLKEHLDTDNEQNECLAERIKKTTRNFRLQKLVVRTIEMVRSWLCIITTSRSATTPTEFQMDPILK